MKSVSRSIGLAFTINSYILQYVLGQIVPVLFIHKSPILSAEGVNELGKITEWRLKFSYPVL